MLTGVANIFLEVLCHDVCLDYQTPIISQHGEVAGRLHVEIQRTSGSLGRLEPGGSCSGDQDPGSLTVRLAIKSATGQGGI